MQNKKSHISPYIYPCFPIYQALKIEISDKITIDCLTKVVSEYFLVDMSLLTNLNTITKGQSIKGRRYRYIRLIFIYLLKHKIGLKDFQIANIVNLSRSTIGKNILSIEQRIKLYPEIFRVDLLKIEYQLEKVETKVPPDKKYKFAFIEL